MSIADPGTPWTVDEARAVGRVGVGAGRRADASRLPRRGARRARARPEARARRPGARPPRRAAGRLVLDADFDPAVLRHVTVLKLNEEEAETLGGERSRRGARSPRGAAHARLDRRRSWSPAASASGCPCGGSRAQTRPAPGDAFLAAYVWARAAGTARSRPPARRRSTAARVLEARPRERARPDRRGRLRGRRRDGGGARRADDVAVDHERLELELPRLVAASAAGATVVAVVDRRPPLLVSGDAGATWREAGRRAAARLRRRGRPGRSRPRALRGPQPALPLDATAAASGARSRPSCRTSRPSRGRSSRAGFRRIVTGCRSSSTVTDLAVSLDFYERALGWPRNGRIDYANYVELLAPDGGALGLYERAGFEQTVGAPPAEIPEGRVAPAYLYVRVDDVGPTVRRIESAGGRALSPLARRAWRRERRLVREYPDGNVLAVAHAARALRQPELAARDGDRRAADLDRLDLAVRRPRPARRASTAGRSRRPARSRSARPTGRRRAGRGGRRAARPRSRSPRPRRRRRAGRTCASSSASPSRRTRSRRRGRARRARSTSGSQRRDLPPRLPSAT